MKRGRIVLNVVNMLWCYHNLRCFSSRTSLTAALTVAPSNSQRQSPATIVVVGGGPAGIFSAISAANHYHHEPKHGHVQVKVLESSSQTLSKVIISGGGRCNVLHDTSKPISELLQGYPRGKQELNGLLHKRYTPKDAQEWFETRGVPLKTEADGRMFPTTDSSSTIVNALLEAANQARVTVETRTKVHAIEKQENGSFHIQLSPDDALKRIVCDAVVLATGSAQVGYKLAVSLGHSIVPTVPSLFTLSTKHAVKEDGILHSLSGVSLSRARVSYKLPTSSKKTKYLSQEGPILITHHGLSGPAALKLSAFGAREFAEQKYRGTLKVHWAPDLGSTDDIANMLQTMTLKSPKKQVATVCPLFLSDGSLAIPKRLWASLVHHAGFVDQAIWGIASKKLIRQLALLISDCSLELTSKGTFKEEFVTAGGVNLKEIDLRDMQSKICPGLFLCGELINVDGITGGYNFMNCWGTGFVAGAGVAQYISERAQSMIK